MLLLVACGSASDGDAPAAESAPFDELTETIDRADAVEQQLQEQKERMDRALKAAEESPQ